MTVEFDDIKVNITNPKVYTTIQRLILRLTGVKKNAAENYKHWTEDERKQVIQLFNAGNTSGQIAKALDRTTGSVNMEIYRLLNSGALIKKSGKREFVL